MKLDEKFERNKKYFNLNILQTSIITFYET